MSLLGSSRVSCALILAFGWLFAMACGGKSDSSPAIAAEQEDGTPTAAGAATNAGSTSVPLGGTGASGGSEAMAGGGAPGEPAPIIFEEDFEDSERSFEVGLWMGTGIDSELPIEATDGPLQSGEFSFHIQGVADEAGVDVMWHTGFVFEGSFQKVRFWAKSRLNRELRFTVGGPYAGYYESNQMGQSWEAAVFELDSDWQQFEVDIEDLGYGPDAYAPYSDPFGAAHFILLPGAEYDLWLDNVEFISRTQQ